MENIYFDNSATTKLDQSVLEEMIPYLKDEYGNASSIYKIGRNNRCAIENAREKVAKIINAEPQEIYFTSGGTESDNTAIRGIAYANRKKGNHIITTTIEHHAIMNTFKYLSKQGFEVTYLPVDKDGLVNPEDVRNAIKDTTILVSVMYVNNEIGAIEPIKEIGAICRKHGVFFHSDCAQMFGKVPN